MKLNKMVYFVLIIFSIAVLSAGAMTMTNKVGVDPDVAIRKAVITVNEEQLDLFFDKMKAFAEEHAFAIRIAPTAPTGKDFVVEMWREDFKILAANPFDKGSFRVSIFNILGGEIEEKYIDRVIDALRVHSLEVENATFLEQPGNNVEP
ncbi:MAG: hypothetical protein U5M23_05420 [Marinagarivorans sp.]|nr:hypothetical protein [Marinagarivorans sp.]